MQSLAQAGATRGATGNKLPMPYKVLAEAGIYFRQGTMSMLFSGPGVGKSTIALDYVIESGARTLYISADTDQTTMVTRAAAKVTGQPYSEVERGMATPSGQAYYLGELESLTDLRFMFDSSPSIEDVLETIDAYAMTYGAYPEVVVIDTLTKLYVPDGDEWSAMRLAMDELHILSQNIQAHVMVLHHANGEWDDGTRNPPLSAIKGKLAALPALILSLSLTEDEMGSHIGVAPVKNRHGKHDASGKHVIWMQADFDTMTIGV